MALLHSQNVLRELVLPYLFIEKKEIFGEKEFHLKDVLIISSKSVTSKVYNFFNAKYNLPDSLLLFILSNPIQLLYKRLISKLWNLTMALKILTVVSKTANPNTDPTKEVTKSLAT